MEQNTFSLSPPQSKFSTWVEYLSIPFLVIYVYFMGTAYLNDGWDTDLTINLLIAATWAILIFNNLKSHTQNKQITLSQNAIEIISDNDRQQINWSALQAITITNNALLFDFNDDFNDKSQREVGIDYIEYKELQKLKKQLHSLCEKYSITFSSKY